MDGALVRHDALVRAAVERHGGHVFKTVGDAFCAAFVRASDGVSACVEIQRVLNDEDFSAVGGLRVRCALHTGEAVVRDGDYFGPALTRVARLVAAGHGGQVLLTQVARDLAGHRLPTGTALVDLGAQRLRDIREPERVWQLNIDGFEMDFPSLRSLDALPNNLPLQHTSLVGREREVEHVKALLERHRLVTLVGTGGVGKTRLALQAGAELLDRYPEGVWFVDFGPVADPELSASVVAQALGMSQPSGHRIEDAILRWLRGKHLLLVLDNCEHLLEPVAALAGNILATAHDAGILATSRQAFGTAGETVHRLPSLATPAAVALFVDRAAAADSRFSVNPENAVVLDEICAKLDGIPLAIELAAARVKMLSVRSLAQRLDERFKILTAGTRGALPRQKTLGALIDWSYDLLETQEQLMFARLGVFAGGFGLDAAAAICAGEGIDELDVFDLLASLIDKSLVAADTSDALERYRLLESMRAYAIEKLQRSGEAGRFARRHAEHFREQAEAADERHGSDSTSAWLARAELELDNYREALAWALTRDNDAALGATIAGALGPLWWDVGLVVEGRGWIGLALSRVSAADRPEIVARLESALSALSEGTRKHGAALRALKLYESISDSRRAARAKRAVGFGLFQMGRLDEARDTTTGAFAASQACGDVWNAAWCLDQLATLEMARGSLAAAHELYARALAGMKAVPDETGITVVLGNLADLELAAGNAARALQLANEALQIESARTNTSSLAIFHVNIAAYRIVLGDFVGAGESARAALRFAQRAVRKAPLAVALQHLALLAALGGDKRRAAQLLGYVDAQYDQLGSKREATEQWGYEKLLASLRETLDDAEIVACAAQGASWSEDEAVAHAG